MNGLRYSVLRPLLVPFLGPLLVLALTPLVLAFGPSLSPSLAGIKTLGPYALLGVAALLAVWFNRGRPFVLALSLAAAYGAYSWGILLGAQGAAARVLYLVIVLLVPANALLVLALAERGARVRQAGPWLVLLAAEVLLASWAANAALAREAVHGWPEAFDNWALRAPPVPFVGRVMFAVALAAAIWRGWPMRTPLEIGAGAALVAFFIGASWAGTPSVFGAFVAAAGLILLLSLVQESHRLAFRDGLTGLPNRRALEERLRALGGTYTLAMADVDHFKRFNDTHGHDIGDQVLKLVAARLAEVEGGATAYRYGGEEFTLLFPAHSVQQALPHLAKAREKIERYPMAVRGGNRPNNPKEGSKLRGEKQAERALSVTLSMGAAQSSDDKTPSEVLKAADAALYRAKEAGRNRVSI